MVGVAGFEPATPCSRSRCATRLRYTPAAFEEPPLYRRTPWPTSKFCPRDRQALATYGTGYREPRHDRPVREPLPPIRGATPHVALVSVPVIGEAYIGAGAETGTAFAPAARMGRGQAVRQRVLVP